MNGWGCISTELKQNELISLTPNLNAQIKRAKLVWEGGLRERGDMHTYG